MDSVEMVTQLKQLSARVQALETHINKPYIEAFNAISADMHAASTRPCPTCRLVTNVIGLPFGCYEFQARKKAGG